MNTAIVYRYPICYSSIPIRSLTVCILCTGHLSVSALGFKQTCTYRLATSDDLISIKRESTYTFSPPKVINQHESPNSSIPLRFVNWDKAVRVRPASSALANALRRLVLPPQPPPFELEHNTSASVRCMKEGMHQAITNQQSK